jgi:hypothetical protein
MDHHIANPYAVGNGACYREAISFLNCSREKISFLNRTPEGLQSEFVPALRASPLARPVRTTCQEDELTRSSPC